MIKDKNIVVYGRSTPYCGFCENLKKLLNENDIVFEYKDISDEDVYNEYCKFRLKTVPSVFIDGEYFGGFTEVRNIIKEGESS